MPAPQQEPFDLTGAPRPWLGQVAWNRLQTRRYRDDLATRAAIVRLLALL